MEEWRYAKKIYARAGIAYTAFLLMNLVLQAEAAMLVLILNQKGIEIPMYGWGMLLFSLPMYVVGGLLCYLIMRDIPVVQPPQPHGLKAGTLFILFFICIAVMYGGNLLGTGLMSAVNGFFGRSLMNPVGELIENMEIWAIFLMMVVAAPVFEELLYRKLLIDRTLQFGDRSAILMSGFMFGISHGNFYQFFYAFGLGIIFAYIYIRTGKIRYTITFHAIINFMGSVVALQISKNFLLMILYGLLMLAGIIAGVVLLILTWNKKDIRQGIHEIPKGYRFSVCCKNWGMITFFLVSSAIFIVTEFL